MAETRPGRLIRDCPTPYPGGTCGCGCDCTSPAYAAFEDELEALLAEQVKLDRRLRGVRQRLNELTLRSVAGAPRREPAP